MRGFTIAVVSFVLCAGYAHAQMAMGPATEAAPFGSPVDDERVYAHLLADQFEGRFGGGDSDLRWDGQAWVGTDEQRLWLKSEGETQDGKVEGGRLEALYDRPITPFFDLQAGVRYDLDSRPGRTWAAFGVEGLAPYFLNVEATVYVSGEGHLAARAMVSYDQLLTQRLILSPEVEANLYSKADPARDVQTGLSDIDAGLRLRYEITRKFAPYIGVAYERQAGLATNGARLAVGVRSWF